VAFGANCVVRGNRMRCAPRLRAPGGEVFGGVWDGWQLDVARGAPATPRVEALAEASGVDQLCLASG